MIPQDFTIGPIIISKNNRRIEEIKRFHMQFSYGHREILLRYMQLDDSHLFLGVIQHGVIESDVDSSWGQNLGKTPRVNLITRSPLWVFSKDTENRMRSEGHKSVFTIGSPWNYLPPLSPQNLEIFENLRREKRVVVFPKHYNLIFNSTVQLDDIRTKIASWQKISEGAPLTICLYWTEFIDNRWHEICRNENISLVTAGMGSTEPNWSSNQGRTNFLINLRNILYANTHAIFESPTSALFYALDSGLSVSYFPRSMIQSEANFEIGERWMAAIFPDIREEFIASSDLVEIANRFLGKDFVLSPDELLGRMKFRPKVVPKPN